MDSSSAYGQMQRMFSQSSELTDPYKKDFEQFKAAYEKDPTNTLVRDQLLELYCKRITQFLRQKDLKQAQSLANAAECIAPDGHHLEDELSLLSLQIEEQIQLSSYNASS